MQFTGEVMVVILVIPSSNRQSVVMAPGSNCYNEVVTDVIKSNVTIVMNQAHLVMV